MFSNRKKLFSVLFIVFSIFVPVSLAAGEGDSGDSAEYADSDWYYGKIIKSVSFKNLKNVDSKEVEGVTSGFIGKKFTDDVFSSLLDRVYALDIFDEMCYNVISNRKGRSV